MSKRLIMLAGVMLLNLGIALAAVLVQARRLLKENIIDEIKI